MQVNVENFVKTLDYSLTYFFKILSKCNVKSRIILDKDDLYKLYNCLEVKNKKSYDLYIKLKELLNNDSKKELL